jgi:hypothetical protein
MITIRIEGPNATALATEAEAFLRDALQETPERTVVPPEQTPTRADPLAVAALLLSVPGAILATLDIAERLKLAERFDRFLATVKARADNADRIQLCTGGEPALDLVRADRDQVMDAFSKGTDETR